MKKIYVPTCIFEQNMYSFKFPSLEMMKIDKGKQKWQLNLSLSCLYSFSSLLSL